MLRTYNEKCIDELDRMKSSRIINRCSYFELLTDDGYRTAALMHNPDFEREFRERDLDAEYEIYAEYLRRAFKRSLERHRFLVQRENTVSAAFRNVVPYLIVQHVVRYSLNSR